MKTVTWIEVIKNGKKVRIQDDTLDQCFKIKEMEFRDWELIPHKHYKSIIK